MDLFYENILYKEMINYIKNELKHLPFTILVVLVLYGVRVLADSYAITSAEVSFDNTGTSITATNMQNAIDEVYNRATDFSTYNTRLTGVETTIGNNALTTTNQTLTGGINELNSKIANKQSANIRSAMFGNYATGDVLARKIGKLVTLSFECSFTSEPAYAVKTGDIPEAYRPADGFIMTFDNITDKTLTGYMRVYSNGDVVFYAAPTTGKTLMKQISYFASSF